MEAASVTMSNETVRPPDNIVTIVHVAHFVDGIWGGAYRKRLFLLGASRKRRRNGPKKRLRPISCPQTPVPSRLNTTPWCKRHRVRIFHNPTTVIEPP
jgi:hypothetical protein